MANYMKDSMTVSFDGFMTYLQGVMKMIDGDIDAMLEVAEARHEQPVSCHTCTEPGCCYQKTMISMWEAFLIATEVRRRGLDTPAYRERLRVLGEEMEGAPRDRWLEEREPCIFLENKRCSIYEIRPTMCRCYYVFSPPENCSDVSGTAVLTLQSDNLMMAIMQFGIRAHHVLHLKETAMRALMATLPRALLLALEAYDHPDYTAFLRRQPWPVPSRSVEWLEGGNPFSKLYQIRRTKKEGPAHDPSAGPGREDPGGG